MVHQEYLFVSQQSVSSTISSNLEISMSTYSIQNKYTIYSSIYKHVFYNFLTYCLNYIYVTLPGTILELFSKSDINRENISLVWYVRVSICFCVSYCIQNKIWKIQYIIQTTQSISYKTMYIVYIMVVVMLDHEMKFKEDGRVHVW